MAPVCLAEDLCPLLQEHQGYAPSAAPEAYEFLDSLGNLLGTPTEIRLFPSSDARVSKRAAAQVCGAGGDERWIFYDESYLNSLSPDARHFVLAHEAAHHITGDSLRGNSWTKDMELLADRSAAGWLSRLRATRDQVIQAFEALALPVESVAGYPTRFERRANILDGIAAAAQPLFQPGAISTLEDSTKPNALTIPRNTSEVTTAAAPTGTASETNRASPVSRRGYAVRLVGATNLVEVEVWPLRDSDADHLSIKWKNNGIEQIERLDDISGVEVKQRSLKPYTGGGTVIQFGVKVGGPKEPKVNELTLTVRRGAKSIVYRFVSDSVLCKAGAACLEGLDGGERIHQLGAAIQSLVDARKASLK